MANLSFYAVCPFGLEELLAGEISACGAERIRAARGGVSFSGSAATAMAVCLNSRLASRVLMKVAEASYWDTRDIYEMAADTPWEKWFGPDLTIKVSANGQRCPLESIDFAVLRIKDGICDRFRDLAGRRPDVERYNPDVRIAAFLTYDTCTFYLDLAGEALFKRGWRLTHGEAPLKENLAAGLLMLSGWDPSQTLIDPFCGSGTIAIEAAMIAQRRAPGLLRRFDAEKWSCFDKSVWQQARESALDLAQPDAKFDIVGSDIDPDCVQLSIENARKAGVANTVFFERADATKRDYSNVGVLFANPPYGERLLDLQQAEKLYADLGRATKNSPMKQYLLSSDPLFERCYGRKADKRRKLYNGMIKCELHMYFKDPSASNRGENKHSDRPSAKRPAKR